MNLLLFKSIACRHFFKNGLLKCLILFACLLQTPKSFAAYFEYTPALFEAQKYLVALRLKEANSILKAEALKHPDNIAIYYLQHYSSFYRVMVQQDKKLLLDFERINAFTLTQIHNLADNSPYKLFLRGSIHLQSALVKGAFNEYLSAAWDFRTSYQEINLNERKFPAFLGHKLELGTLMALIGTFPKQYEWVVNVVGLEGDFDKGVKILSDYIKNATHEPMIEQQQAMVVYTLIQLNFGPEKKKAWAFCKDKTKDYQHNLLQCYLRAFVAGKCGENDIALQTLKARPTDEAFEQISYLNFLMGNYLLYQIDFSSAIWFKKYLAFSITKGSFKEAYQKLSWIAWLQNDTTKFITYTHLMEKHTKDAGSETNLMKADLARNIYPSTDLIKARLLFDGGYYEQANVALHKLPLNTLTSNFQKLEWEYRVARILQEENKLSEAIVHYKKCIEIGKELNSYLLPNSCLQLGQIFEQLNYPELAKSYYKKVFTYDNFDYESSIDQKAKTNLIRLK